MYRRVRSKSVFAEMTLLMGLLVITINNRDVAFSYKKRVSSFIDILIRLVFVDPHYVFILYLYLDRKDNV